MAVSLLIFLPVFISIVFCFGFISYFVQIKTKLRSHCLLKTIEIQKNLIQSENALFALNPVSTLLRTQLLLAEAALIAAIATGNEPAVVQTKIEIHRIKKLQTELDLQQKKIILGAKIKSESDSFQLLTELNRILIQNKNIWNFYINSTSQINQTIKPQFAVQADSSDVAPNYELDLDYKSIQTVRFKLQHRFQTTELSQNMIKTQNVLSLSCGSRPQMEAQHWTIEINADKF